MLPCGSGTCPGAEAASTPSQHAQSARPPYTPATHLVHIGRSAAAAAAARDSAAAAAAAAVAAAAARHSTAAAAAGRAGWACLPLGT